MTLLLRCYYNGAWAMWSKTQIHLGESLDLYVVPFPRL